MYLVDVILLDISLSPQSSNYAKPKELPFRRLRDIQDYTGLDLDESRSLEIRAEREHVVPRYHALEFARS